MRNLDAAYIALAYSWAKNSRAVRLKVGAIIVKDGQIISDGYNGTPYGMDNVCEVLRDTDKNETFDITLEEAESIGAEIAFGNYKNYALVSKPDVVHAELNAILKCARHQGGAEGATLYITDSPCYQCAITIVQSGIKRVVYDREYRITDGLDLLRKAGVEVVKI